jgi:uncharacterized membrane protein YeiH
MWMRSHLGVYAVVGADKAMAAGIGTLGAVVVGMTNAIGGGFLRDIIVREEPLMFKPGQVYVFAALGGCLLFIGLVRRYDVPVQQSAFIAILVTLLLRLLAIRFNWTTAPVSEWEQSLRKNLDRQNKAALVDKEGPAEPSGKLT